MEQNDLKCFSESYKFKILADNRANYLEKAKAL